MKGCDFLFKYKYCSNDNDKINEATKNAAKKLVAYDKYLKQVENGKIAILLKEEITELLNNIDRWTHPDITKLVAKYIEQKTEMKLL